MPSNKKCKWCGSKFMQFNSLIVVCSVECAIAIAPKMAQRKRETEAREWRKETARRKQAMKTRRDWLKEAQAEFNKYIRLRDADLPCISCGRYHDGQYHASHYRSVGACSSLRFHEDNVHKACSVCNAHLSGNIIEYRIALVAKIGQERVEWLESQPKEFRWTVEQAREIKQTYAAKSRELKKESV